jgi:hypothetical protein
MSKRECHLCVRLRLAGGFHRVWSLSLLLGNEERPCQTWDSQDLLP